MILNIFTSSSNVNSRSIIRAPRTTNSSGEHVVRQTRRQGRGDYRGRTGHRSRHGGSLRTGGRDGLGDGRQSQDPGRTPGQAGDQDPDPRRDGRDRGQCGRQGHRRNRHPLQLCRLRAPGQHFRLHAQGLGVQLQPERALHVLHLPRLPAGHAGEGGRVDHQHVLDRLQRQRPAEPRRVRRLEGGRDRLDQGDRRRLREAGHPLQLHRPWDRGHAVAA